MTKSKLPTYVDIALPVSVRQVFTYSLPRHLINDAEVGKRAWVPFRRKNAIGMIVKIHEEKPDFKTRPIKRVLDQRPVMSKELLNLTYWVHMYYFCGWGEAIQSALPAGMNYQHRLLLSVARDPMRILDRKSSEIFEIIRAEQPVSYEEAQRRWKSDGMKRVDDMVDNGELDLVEDPIQKNNVPTVTAWEWHENADPDKIEELAQGSNKWNKALKRLTELEPPFTRALFDEEPLLNDYSMKRIEKEEELLQKIDLERTKVYDHLDFDPDAIKNLNSEQQIATDAICDWINEEEYKTVLLEGITGSGKTEVYIHALKHARAQGKGALVLVPEIALTPQTVRRFYMIFGEEIAVVHSRLTPAERLMTWEAIGKGEKNIVIGPRSAVFAPVQKLGLIVLDEEHDRSYRQIDPDPRYHARETAQMRAWMNKSVVILGSATPSLGTLHKTQTKEIEHLSLRQRHASATLPEVTVIDLKKYKSGMKGDLAVPLYLEIKSALGRGEQAILLLNRRGYSRMLQCTSCGHVLECPNCSVSLTFHRTSGSYRCHYCGFSRRHVYECEKCHHHDLQQMGTGTQQLESQFESIFPEANILRMDQDTTSGKNAHEELLDKFRSGESNLLIGTQLVAKGLDFPNVTVVGVVNADTELAFPVYDASERMFQLLSQVAGRSGRGTKKGVVFLQTWKPDHHAIQFAQKHDYRGFAKKELENREMLFYPPFTKMIRFELKSEDEQAAAHVAEKLVEAMKLINESWPVMGPSPAAILRIRKEFRWEVNLKIAHSNRAKGIEKGLNMILDKFNELEIKNRNKVRLNIHVDI